MHALQTRSEVAVGSCVVAKPDAHWVMLRQGLLVQPPWARYWSTRHSEAVWHARHTVSAVAEQGTVMNDLLGVQTLQARQAGGVVALQESTAAYCPVPHALLHARHAPWPLQLLNVLASGHGPHVTSAVVVSAAVGVWPAGQRLVCEHGIFPAAALNVCTGHGSQVAEAVNVVVVVVFMVVIVAMVVVVVLLLVVVVNG
jgi:hypothetical protein